MSNSRAKMGTCGLAVAAGACALMLLSGCSWLDPKPTFKAGYPRAVAPQRFLFTGDENFEEWLDQPMRILIDRIPLTEIFKLPALAPMTYRLYDMPPENPLVSVDSIGISRRQLLWALAHEYNLEMHAHFVYPEEPIDISPYIEVRGKTTAPVPGVVVPAEFSPAALDVIEETTVIK